MVILENMKYKREMIGNISGNVTIERSSLLTFGENY